MLKHHVNGTLLYASVKPRSKKQSILIDPDSSTYLIMVKAAPVRGQANKEVVKLVAKRLGISSQRVTIVFGLLNKTKTLLIEDMDPSRVRAALGS